MTNEDFNDLIGIKESYEMPDRLVEILPHGVLFRGKKEEAIEAEEKEIEKLKAVKAFYMKNLFVEQRK